MSNFEWITTIAVLLGGFWTLSKNLSDIKIALQDKVSYNDCSKKREHCPCVKMLDEMRKKRNV